MTITNFMRKLCNIVCESLEQDQRLMYAEEQKITNYVSDDGVITDIEYNFDDYYRLRIRLNYINDNLIEMCEMRISRIHKQSRRFWINEDIELFDRLFDYKIYQKILNGLANASVEMKTDIRRREAF